MSGETLTLFVLPSRGVYAMKETHVQITVEVLSTRNGASLMMVWYTRSSVRTWGPVAASTYRRSFKVSPDDAHICWICWIDSLTANTAAIWANAKTRCLNCMIDGADVCDGSRTWGSGEGISRGIRYVRLYYLRMCNPVLTFISYI